VAITLSRPCPTLIARHYRLMSFVVVSRSLRLHRTAWQRLFTLPQPHRLARSATMHHRAVRHRGEPLAGRRVEA